MKRAFVRMLLSIKAALQLGLVQSFWYAVYQAGLRSGYYRMATPTRSSPAWSGAIRSPYRLPHRDELQAIDSLGDGGAVIAAADEIVNGQVRLFGGPPVPLVLRPPDSSRHWTYYERRPAVWGVEDIKFIWEPARFGWVYTLGRAYRREEDERYPETFWRYFAIFQEYNPPNQGPNWASAQEVALRLLALLFAARVFETSPHSTPERMASLAQAVADHAQRIPVTISYARAQNNNHLISEALGLYLAGYALPGHPKAGQWQQTGWRWIHEALQRQIRPDGAYVQHSMNYHRLMLHAALQAQLPGRPFPKTTAERLAAATCWLLAQVDPHSGRAPNLGSNDGALILPLASSDFTDYRPVAQAAARAFLGRPAFEPGPWDEPCLWLGLKLENHGAIQSFPQSQGVRRLGDTRSWAVIRATRYKSRPAHADQLHVDLFWQGENIALDAGTYRYTAPAPWDNALAQTLVHNTVEVNGQNQMLRAGRFLWLDWAQATLLNTRNFQAEVIAAQHNGYQHLGVRHRRILKRSAPDRWLVIDYLLRMPTLRLDVPRHPSYPCVLQWLLPDWPWELKDNTLILSHPAGGRVRLTLRPSLPPGPQTRRGTISLVRAGETLAGTGRTNPLLGWYSPTYNQKIPALSFSMSVRAPLPFSISSEWVLEAEPAGAPGS